MLRGCLRAKIKLDGNILPIISNNRVVKFRLNFKK